MGLSLALHGLAVVLLLAAGAAGSSTSGETALLIELALAPAADAPIRETESASRQQPTQQETAEAVETGREQAAHEATTEPVEPAPQQTAAIELAPAQEPPPVDVSQLKRESTKSKRATAEHLRAAKAPAQSSSPKSDFGSATSAQQAAAGFLTAAPIVWEGKPRYRHPPTPAVYPSRAIELGQQGEVLVRVHLDAGGGAVEILIHRSSGSELLDRAAVTAVRQWQFLPAMRDGHPVAAWVEIPVRFQLR